jgi:hypothetical protein
MDRTPGTTSSPNVAQRGYTNGPERRTERTTITTREKIQVKSRNPVNEPVNAENRGNSHKPKSTKVPPVEIRSPRVKDKDKDAVVGKLSSLCRNWVLRTVFEELQADKTVQLHGIPSYR